jgi:hypothetical protein
MAPRQNTFTVVPNPMGLQGLMARPANGPESKPPMTSKQAQKAYRERTRGPRQSKAEQRLFELAEQERIRRELDKEKSLNRARTLRERKKAKEKLALGEKKRKGLPLVKVRPSQDTIARFVRRGNGLGNKRDSEGAEVGLLAIEEEAEDDRSVTEGGVGQKADVAGAGVDLPVIEEQEEDDWSDKHMPSNEAANTRDYKRLRLRFGLIEDKGDIGKTAEVQSTEMPAGAVELGEAAPIPEASRLKVTDMEPALKEAEVSGPAVEFLGEKDLTAKAQEQADDNHMSSVAKGAPDIAVGTVRNREKDGLGCENIGHGEPEAEKTAGSERTTDPKGNIGPKIAMPQAMIHPDTASPGLSSTTQPSRSHENTAQAKTTKALDKSRPEAPATTPGIPPFQQRTPAQGIAGCEKTTLTTPKTQLRGSIASPMPNKTPVDKATPTPEPQHPPPKHTPAQHPSTRRVLQETTNSSNRGRPASGTGGASKFVSPYKSALAPQRQAPRSVPAFKQHRPETPTGRVPKPKFLPPPHLRNASVGPHPPRPASGSKQGKRFGDMIPNSPPTSTQLFVMSHIDDVFPSPSQEAEEIQGNPPAVGGKQFLPAPARQPIAGFATRTATRTAPRPRHEMRRGPHANAPLAPIPGFATRPAPRPKQFTRQVIPANAPMAPPARPATVKAAAAKLTESFDFSFISTQDLLFSSQDLRELEETTPSKAKGTEDGRPPPCKGAMGTIQQRPSPLSHSSDAPIQQTTPQSRTERPTLAANQRATSPHLARPPGKGPEISKQSLAARGQHTPDINRPVPPPRADNSVEREKPAPSTVPGPPSREKPRFFGSNGRGEELLAPRGQYTPDINRPVPPPYADNSAEREKPAPSTVPGPPSREKPRFFGSNGRGEELLAIKRSRRTYEEEERKRLAESRAQRGLVGTSSAGAEQKQAAQKGNSPNNMVETVSSVKSGREQGKPACPQRECPQTTTDENNTRMGQGKTVAGGGLDVVIHAASQETDYGDVELDSMDFYELGLGSLLA